MTQRDTLRSRIFSARAKAKIVTYNGVEIEVRQPSLKSVIEGNDGDNKQATVRMLIENCFVPGTEEKIFEDTDYDSLLAMPFSSEWVAMSEAITELTGLKKEVDKQAGN